MCMGVTGVRGCDGSDSAWLWVCVWCNGCDV